MRKTLSVALEVYRVVCYYAEPGIAWAAAASNNPLTSEQPPRHHPAAAGVASLGFTLEHDSTNWEHKQFNDHPNTQQSILQLNMATLPSYHLAEHSYQLTKASNQLAKVSTNQGGFDQILPGTNYLEVSYTLAVFSLNR